MQAPETVEGTRGLLVKAGLGGPYARGFVAAVTVGIVAYAFRLPERSFDEDGKLAPFKGVSKAPNATYVHFLTVPVTAGVLTSLFT